MTTTTIMIEGKEFKVNHENGEIVSINDKTPNQCDTDSLQKVYDRLFPENK